MTALTLPGLASLAEAFAWLEEATKGREVVSVALYRSPDGLVRGSVMLRAARGSSS